jgi:hypothetical protein
MDPAKKYNSSRNIQYRVAMKNLKGMAHKWFCS